MPKVAPPSENTSAPRRNTASEAARRGSRAPQTTNPAMKGPRATVNPNTATTQTTKGSRAPRSTNPNLKNPRNRK